MEPLLFHLICCVEPISQNIGPLIGSILGDSIPIPSREKLLSEMSLVSESKTSLTRILNVDPVLFGIQEYVPSLGVEAVIKKMFAGRIKPSVEYSNFTLSKVPLSAVHVISCGTPVAHEPPFGAVKVTCP